MKRYLTLASLDDTLVLLRSSFSCNPSCEEVPLLRSAGRVTSEPILANYSVPEIHLAAIDGIAVRSDDTIGAGEQNPVTLDDAVRRDTGNVVPPEYDAVIMIEDVLVEGNRFTIRKAAPPWQHVRPAGEDIGESEMALPSRHLIRPHDIGALAAYGVTKVAVITVRVGLVPTGTELVTHGTRPKPGQVVESNTVMAEAMLGAIGASCKRYPVISDEPARMRGALERAVADNDMVIVSAGSSAGTKDFTADVIAELGEVLVHGVAMKPGKPVIIGRVDNKPVIGMPGYPLSALTVLREIVMPVMAQHGLPVPAAETTEASLTTTIHKEPGSDEFVLCSLGRVGGRWVVSPQSRGAGIQMSAVRANAYLKIPADGEGYEAGETVTARLTTSRNEAKQVLLVTGSHDTVLDYLADRLRKKGISLHPTHAGSMGGILALKKDVCHAAPMHLLSENGDYNIPYLIRHLPGVEVVLICVAERKLGIVSLSGMGIDELPGHRFVNRQRGSGTRILLDHELKKRGIDPSRITGYDREVTTHLAVALAVKSGEAEAGMCVYSAARAFNLPFVPVAPERYEIAIRASHLGDPRVAELCDAIASPDFRSALHQLGGYGTAETGVRRQPPPS